MNYLKRRTEPRTELGTVGEIRFIQKSFSAYTVLLRKWKPRGFCFDLWLRKRNIQRIYWLVLCLFGNVIPDSRFHIPLQNWELLWFQIGFSPSSIVSVGIPVHLLMKCDICLMCLLRIGIFYPKGASVCASSLNMTASEGFEVVNELELVDADSDGVPYESPGYFDDFRDYLSYRTPPALAIGGVVGGTTISHLIGSLQSKQ